MICSKVPPPLLRHLPILSTIKMSFLSPCRAALLQSSRRTARVSTTNRSLLATQWYQQRHASTSKHPKGFAPPTQDDLEELRERTVEFARREIPQDVAQAVDHTNEFPNDMWRKMGEAGFLGITADEDYGGLAMGYQAHCTVMEELSRASGKIQHHVLTNVNTRH
jgi:isovaleryl-CoA dehydrogenase